jgi:hypothetical protein
MLTQLNQCLHSQRHCLGLAAGLLQRQQRYSTCAAVQLHTCTFAQDITSKSRFTSTHNNYVACRTPPSTPADMFHSCTNAHANAPRNNNRHKHVHSTIHVEARATGMQQQRTLLPCDHSNVKEEPPGAVLIGLPGEQPAVKEALRKLLTWQAAERRPLHSCFSVTAWSSPQHFFNQHQQHSCGCTICLHVLYAHGDAL